jgi:putative ABC transport system permease protein
MAVVLTLAVGLAGTTIMFAVIEGVLLRKPPFPAPAALVIAWKQLPSGGLAHFPYRMSELEVIRREVTQFETIAGVGYNGAGESVAIENGAATYISTASVSGDFFRVIGVTPVLGRALARGDDVEGAENVLVITHGLWQRRYGGALDVLGRRLQIDGVPFTIVGVMPSDLDYPRGVEAWATLTASASTLVNPAFREGVLRDVDLIGRLRSGATLEQAASELRVLTSRIETASADTPRDLTPVVRSYKDVVVGDVRQALLILFGAVGLVWLIASANAANLLLLRGEARRQELAVRAALGATRGRLVRELLIESLLLAFVAAGLGFTVSWWTLRTVVMIVPDGLPRAESVRIDAVVILFTFAGAFVTAACAGLAPALSSSGADVVSELRAGSTRGSGYGLRRRRRTLVLAQVSLAVTIAAAAGLLVRTLLRLQALDMGLAANRLVFVELDLPEAKYADSTRHLQFLQDLVRQLEAAPGIAAATPVNTAPFAGTGGWDLPVFTAEGQTAQRAMANPSLNLESVHPNYFEALGVTILRGRGFADADRQGAPNVAIVSEDVAARTWPGEDPIGKRIKFGGLLSTDAWRTVVGVAKRTRYRELPEPRPTLYLPAEQFIVAAHMLVLRTSVPLAEVAALARARVSAVDPDVRVMRVAPFVELLGRPLARPRFNAWLISCFSLIAVALASIGLYAVLSASVRLRYKELAIRLALGATSSNVRRLVLGEGLRLAVAGVALGLAGFLVVARFLRGLLFGVAPLDPTSIIGSALLLLAIAIVASYLPARRATRLDPIASLRMN